jgi:hypothetical protein
MLETLFKLFLQSLHPAIALPLAIVLAGLFASLVGKSKSLFDAALTVETARTGVRYVLPTIAATHAILGIGAAYWFYFHSNQFSPPVDTLITHPLGREFIRRSDWSLIGVEAFAYLSLLVFQTTDRSRLRSAKLIFIGAVVPTAICVVTVASLYPSFITPLSNAPTPWSPLGFLWWHADVVLTALPVGLIAVLVWFLIAEVRVRQ